MNEWVKKASPEIHQVLKKHGKQIANQIRLALESRGFGKADDGEDNSDNSNQADAILNGVDMSSFSSDLNSVMNPIIYQIYINGMEEAAKELSGSFVRDPKYHEYANDYATQRAAELAGTSKNPKYALTDSTREMLRNDLVNMMDQGLTPAEIAKNLENDYAFSESRAMTIARTETGFTWNRGAINMYRSAGVKLLNVHDGDHDEECRAANGQVWSADYASVNALSHPNCTRSFSPNLDPDAQPDEY
jgi:SPP1 gp7 family putative phage head morphogenesis protein